METIKIKYCIEDLKSRLPGLFPYLEFDGYGNCNLMKATESIEGCYNQVMPSFTLPENVSLDNILLGGETYTYKTLYNYYYQYKDIDSDNSFIQWFMKGIGKFKVIIPGINRKECDLLPEYGYYSECGSIYNDYYKMRLIINNYNKWKDETHETNYELDKICEEYTRMGGDVAKDYYKGLEKEANDIAEEYLKYASIEESNYSLSLNIISSYNDLGMVNTYMDYWVPEKIYENGDYIIYNDTTYICINNTKCRKWNDEEERYEFDPDGWEEAINWQKQKHYHIGEYVIYEDKTYICISDHQSSELWEDDSDKWYCLNENIELVGQTNSKLSGFKAGKNYISVDNKIETPDYNEDWLWYYNIGDISYTESMTDELGNIMMIEGAEREISTDSTETNLMLYGNVLTDIKYENNKLTFTYVIGAHLTAVLKEIKTDDDGKKRYYYDEFKYDENDKNHGVIYTETYSVAKDSEIDILIEEGLFEKYITTNKLSFQTMDESLLTEDISYARFKCPFMLKLLSVNRGVNSINSNFNYLPASFKVNINKVRTEDLHMPITKLDYFTGTTYQPQVQADIHVNRGNATAWERHIKLGEIKTFQAMLDYANGGFFNIK